MKPSPTLHTPSRRRWISGATLGFAALHIPRPNSLLHAATSTAKNRVRVYVGTFSSPLKDVLPTQVDLPPGNGRGIHIFEMDTESGAFQEIGIAELGTSPSCLVLDKRESFLYSANETDRMGAENHGTVSAWKIDSQSGMLSLVNKVTSGGAGPTYVSLHPNGKFLFVANYFGGSIAVHPVLPDGSVGEAIAVKTDEGNIGPTRAKHAPKGSFAISGHDRTHAHDRNRYHWQMGDPLRSRARPHLHLAIRLSDGQTYRCTEALYRVAARGRSQALSLPPQWKMVLFDSGRGLDRRLVRLQCEHRRTDRTPNDFDVA